VVEETVEGLSNRRLRLIFDGRKKVKRASFARFVGSDRSPGDTGGAIVVTTTGLGLGAVTGTGEATAGCRSI
jgi:hypothetical protein